MRIFLLIICSLFMFACASANQMMTPDGVVEYAKAGKGAGNPMMATGYHKQFSSSFSKDKAKSKLIELAGRCIGYRNLESNDNAKPSGRSTSFEERGDTTRMIVRVDFESTLMIADKYEHHYELIADITPTAQGIEVDAYYTNAWANDGKLYRFLEKWLSSDYKSCPK